MSKTLLRSNEADIVLILEGSYPYVIGGVSAWMHEIIKAFPQYKFAVIFIGSAEEDYKKGIRYDLPDNVVHFEKHFIFSDVEKKSIIKSQQRIRSLEAIRFFHDFFPDKNCRKIIESYSDLDFNFDFKPNQTFKSSFTSKESWGFIVDSYKKYCTDPSFINYFWTIKNLKQPLWRLMQILPGFIKVKAVHTISTGYAGFLGALLHFYLQIPLILTEHGIYTKERRIELMQSRIITGANPTEVTYLRNLWIRFFELLSKVCYEGADKILSLYSGAREKQIEEGAKKEKTQIIYNGIDIEKYSQARKNRRPRKTKIVCLLGRIVPIKDIKTFIRAINIVIGQNPDIEAWVAGPTEENPKYFTECQDLVSVLGIGKHVIFNTHVRDTVEEVFSKIDLMVLSSISEGMPLILLEAFASGVPTVATNVGACADLINGADKDDKLLGKSGLVVNIADPQSLADAIIELLGDDAKWKKASDTAIARAEKYYDRKVMFEKYAAVYKEIIK